MHKGLKRIGLGLVAVGLSIVLLLTAALPVCEAGADKREIVVGFRTGFTGPLADALAPFCIGGLDYVKWCNDHGGINGIPVKAMWEDNHSEVVKEISSHKRFVAAGAVVEISYASGSASATWPLQRRDEIPLFSNEIDEGMRTEPHWVVGSVSSWQCHHATIIKWVKENWTEERPPRCGFVGINQPISYTAIEGIPEFCDRIGVEWVGYDIVPLFGCIDTSTELLRLAAKKPDWVYVVCYAATLVTVIKDVHRLELQQKGIKFCSTPQSTDRIVINTAGAAATEGWYTVRAAASPWEDEYLGGIKCPRMAEVREAAKKYRGWEPEEITEWYPCGWFVQIIIHEAIRMALEKVGIENLTGRAVRDAIFSIKDFDTGLLPFPVTISEERPYMVDYFLIYLVQQGKAVPAVAPFPVVLPAELGVRL